MIERIGYEYMSCTVHHNAKWVTQAGVKGYALVASVMGDTNPGNALKMPSDSIPSPHQMIVRIGHVQISCSIQRNSRWPRETGARWFIWSLVPVFSAVAHHSSYHTSDRINSTNPSVKTIGDK
jgi:hypothetical protein